MLGEPARDIAEILERQQAARALQSDFELRQRLEALALGVAPEDTTSKKGAVGPRVPPNPVKFLEWAEGPPVLSTRTLLIWTSRVSPLVGIGLAVLSSMGIVPTPTLLVPFAVHLVILAVTGSETSRVFHAVSATQGAYLRYAPLFELLESLELDAPLVRRLREEALQSSVRPSESMRRFQRGLGWFELRHNGMIHPFANVFLLWDVHCVLGLEAWQARAGRFVRRWFQAIGDLEALSSFAGLAHDDAGYSFPKVSAEGAHFTAEGLAHPLIAAERRVANDVSLPEAGRALLVTGSNMSGKSTLLRSMGLATVMALAGAPACARRLAISPLAVRTSIRISDSLEHGVSHFYAEVGKIKAVLDATGEGTTVFFLLDEILHGTNSEERQIGARWVLAELLRRGALGAVSTHDIELCRLDSPLMNRVALHHFREQVKNDAMSFDYTLRTGPVEGGNALRLMRLSGIDVPLAPSRAADSSVTPKT
jgi:hypothetical protein